MPTLRTLLRAAAVALLAACGDPTAGPSPTIDAAAHRLREEVPDSAAVDPGVGAPEGAAPEGAAPEGAAPAAVLLVSALGANACATAAGAGADAGVEIRGCAGTPTQQFTFRDDGTVTTADGALCLATRGGATGNGTRLALAACDGRTSQRWALTTAGLVRGAIGKCVDLPATRATAGTPLTVWDCHGRTNQRWSTRALTVPPVVDSLPDTPPPPPPPAPPAADTGWTYCTAAGAPCDWLGLRDVRLGGPSGPYVVRTAYAGIPCAVYGFDGVNPAPGQPLHCDYGPLRTTTLANPMPGMGGLPVATVVVPLGDPGAAGPRQRAADGAPPVVGSGNFRTTCGLARYGFVDPIVYPGQPGASHLHAFFGNVAVDAGSTPASLVAGGNSTCRGGTLNRTAYWMPALVDARTGAVVTPDIAVFYYKSGYNMDPATIQPPPAGLRMIAGNKSAAAQAQQPYGIGWGCRDRYVPNTGSIPTTCPVGDAVRLTIIFPQCWDGRNLDAPDHASHVAFPVYRNPPARSSCPATHPIPLPEITEHFDFPVLAGATPASWRLTSDMYPAGLPGGYSAHADWMNGWNPAIMQTLVTRCINQARDCGVGLLGDGTTLY